MPIGNAIRVILGSPATIFGWGIFSFLMIFGWSFGGNSDTTFVHFYGELNSTKGRIVNIVETSMSINDESVWANVYEYHDQNGNNYIRDAFTTGFAFDIGEQVDVNYVVNAPEYARVNNARNAMMGPWGLLMFILPAIGILVIYFGIKHGWSQYQKMLNKKIPSIGGNQKPVKEILLPIIFVGPHIWYITTLF